MLPRMNGTAISEEQKLDFLDYVRQGYPRNLAAENVGSKGSRFRALCRPGAPNYDERFAGIYNQIMESGEFEDNRLEMLRATAFKRAILEDTRLLISLLQIHDPEWAPLRPNRVDVNVNLRAVVQQHFGHLSAEGIRTVLALLERNDEENIIEAIPRELEEAI